MCRVSGPSTGASAEIWVLSRERREGGSSAQLLVCTHVYVCTYGGVHVRVRVLHTCVCTHLCVWGRC